MQEQVTVMITYYRTDDQVIHEEEKLSDGVWVQMINPTHDECEEIAEKLMVDIDDVKAALDVEESSRIELQDGYTLILVDIPTIEIRHDQRTYTTIPLGIILTQDITHAHGILCFFGTTVDRYRTAKEQPLHRRTRKLRVFRL